jgi:Zn-dependent protease with chaperone function
MVERGYQMPEHARPLTGGKVGTEDRPPIASGPRGRSGRGWLPPPAGFVGPVAYGSALRDGDLIPHQMGAHPVPPGELPVVQSALSELCATAGIAEPRLWVAHDDVPNAFATGFSPESAAVTLTAGLLERVDPPGLRAVLAHEVGHIALGHIARNTELASQLANGATLAALATAVVGGAMAAATESESDDALVGILAIAAAQSQERSALQKLRGQQRASELEADDFAAIVGGDHQALGRTLTGIDRYVSALPAEAMAGWLRLLCIVEPEDGLATHPPTAARLHHARQWAITATTGWACPECAFTEAGTASWCRRCGTGRTDQLPTTAERHDQAGCPAAPPDARFCPSCGGSTDTAIDLQEVVTRRRPTPLGLPPHRVPAATAPVARGTATSVTELAREELRRIERFTLAGAIRRADALLEAGETPLALTSCRFTSSLGAPLSGLLVLTPTRLIGVGSGWHEWMGLAEIAAHVETGDGCDLRIAGLPVGLALSGSGAATAHGLLQIVDQRRRQVRGRVAW